MNTLIVSLLLLFFTSSPTYFEFNTQVEEPVMAQRSMSLNVRHSNQFVNEVFRDNILLNIAYINNGVRSPKDINWEEIRKPFTYELILNPGEQFAYHDTVLPEYEGEISKTTNAHFNAQDGFRNSGYLYGDGVCHLASLMYWAAKDAGLKAVSPASHDFAKIPEVPSEYGVSIYYMPGNSYRSEVQNLYIKNTKDRPIAFRFVYDQNNLTIDVVDKS